MGFPVAYCRQLPLLAEEWCQRLHGWRPVGEHCPPELGDYGGSADAPMDTVPKDTGTPRPRFKWPPMGPMRSMGPRRSIREECLLVLSWI